MNTSFSMLCISAIILMLIGMLFLGSVQIFFIGLLGEYILSINQRVMRRPLVVEEERLNFPEDAMIGGMADASK